MPSLRLPLTTAVLLASIGCMHAPPPPVPRASLLFVTNEASNDVSVVDLREDRVVANIPVGKRPRGVRLAPDGRTLYVALSGSLPSGPGEPPPRREPDRTADGIAVVDVVTRALVRVLPAGDDPETFDLSPDGARLYVSNEESATASVVDVVSGRVIATALVGEEPEGVRTRPDGRAIYVTSERTSTVTAISPAGEVLGSFATGKRPRGVAFTPDGALALVTAEEGHTVTIADARRHEVLATVPIDAPRARPMGIVVSPDGRRAYVANGRVGSVSVIDLTTRRTVATWSTGGERSWGVALSPDGARLYTANGGTDDVSVLDATTGRVLARIPVGGRPWGIAVRP